MLDIPKKIHYCWFGRGEKPELAKKCIASWKKFLPDYEIIEWNEDNFDVNIIPYTAQAYSAKKYAFVSDYARFYILYQFGGLYFDTDVEVIKPLDDIIKRGAFMGVEVDCKTNPGLGLGVAPGLGLYKEILDYYHQLSFLDSNGYQIPGTVVMHTTNVLKRHGLKQSDEIQEVAGVWIYPCDYFNPLNEALGKLELTENSRSIHWYAKSWIDKRSLRKAKLGRILRRIFGEHWLDPVKTLIKKIK